MTKATETIEDTSNEMVAAEWEINADDVSALEAIPTESGVAAEIRELVTGAPAMYTSMRGDGFEDRLKVLGAITNSKPISENLGVKINLRHIIVQKITLVNRETGVVSDQPRVIMIDDKGVAFHAISKGLFLSIKNIIGVVGEPTTWDKPIPVVVKRERAAVGHFFTVDIAG